MLLSRKALVFIITLLAVLHVIPYTSGTDDQSIYSSGCQLTEYGYVFGTRNLNYSAFDISSGPIGKERKEVVWTSVDYNEFFKDNKSLPANYIESPDVTIQIDAKMLEFVGYFYSSLISVQTLDDHIDVRGHLLFN